MNCPYCRATNDSDSHRCVRCGRRLNDDGPVFPVQMSSAVPVIDLDPREFRQPEIPPAPRGPQIVRELPKGPAVAPPAADAGAVVQQSLFGPMVVQKQAPAKTTRSSTQSRKRQDGAAQQAFDFATHTLPTSVAAAVSCDAPVALYSHRAVAAAIDTAIPAVGFGLFLATMHFAGLVQVEHSEMLGVYGAALTAITLFYRLLCCFGSMDTPGLQWSGLRLLNFHGLRPTRAERFRRLASGLVSLVSLGIGLLWATVDEEHLTWHDYMSHTFPSPRFEE